MYKNVLPISEEALRNGEYQLVNDTTGFVLWQFLVQEWDMSQSD